MDSRTLKWILLIVSVLYIVSPVDGMPGPVDDIIVAVSGCIASGIITRRRKLKANNKPKEKNTDERKDDDYYVD